MQELEHQRITQLPTGIKDKNSVEIYSGDLILLDPVRHPFYPDTRIVGEVFWDEGSAQWMHTYHDGRPPNRMFARCEVIGNIYEKPELLENDYIRRNIMQDQPKKSHAVRTIVVLALIGFVIIGAMGSASTPEATTTGPSAPVAVAPVTTQPETPKTWQKVAELAGSTSKRGDVFHLNGGKQRITYTITPGTSPFITIYVMKAGENLQDDGGFGEVTMADESGETLAYKAGGDYYLDISAGNGDWTVVVEEMR